MFELSPSFPSKPRPCKLRLVPRARVSFGSGVTGQTRAPPAKLVFLAQTFTSIKTRLYERQGYDRDGIAIVGAAVLVQWRLCS